jgi:hypothetical protein
LPQFFSSRPIFNMKAHTAHARLVRQNLSLWFMRERESALDCTMC